MTPGEHIERALLGACIVEDERTLDLLVSALRPAHFSLDSHKRIAHTIVRLYRKQQPVNSVTVPEELAQRQEIDVVGGRAYIAGLTEGLPMRLGETAMDHVERLKEFWRKRELLSLSAEIADGTAADESHSIIQGAMARLETIVNDSITEDPAVENFTVPTLDRWNNDRQRTEPPGLSFGIEDLDQATGGLRPGHQIAMGAASGVGKSTVLAQALFVNGRKGIPCHAFLLEMTREEMLGKLWSMEAGVRYKAITDPQTANATEVEQIREAAYRVAAWPIRLHDKGLTLDRVLGLARLSINRYGSRLVALDYIQRLKIEQAERDEPLRQRVARASMGMADLVKGTRCCSLLLSQLTTGRKSGAQSKPTMYDFRESSQIENDAHTIVLLHREFDEKQGHFTSDGAILVPKVRFGAPCNLTAKFDTKMAVWRAGKKRDYFEGDN